MKYTNHFSHIIRANGAPHLDRHQLQRMMNIVFIESGIDTLEKLNLNSRPVFMKINSYKSKLIRLTKELDPDNLILEMVRLSEIG